MEGSPTRHTIRTLRNKTDTQWHKDTTCSTLASRALTSGSCSPPNGAEPRQAFVFVQQTVHVWSNVRLRGFTCYNRGSGGTRHNTTPSRRAANTHRAHKSHTYPHEVTLNMWRKTRTGIEDAPFQMCQQRERNITERDCFGIIDTEREKSILGPSVVPRTSRRAQLCWSVHINLLPPADRERHSMRLCIFKEYRRGNGAIKQIILQSNHLWLKCTWSGSHFQAT